MAAEQIFFTYGPLGRSITVDELKDLAATGKPSNKLRWYLDFAKVDPEEFRQILTQEITLSPRVTNQILYTLPAEYGLFEVGQTVHSKSRQVEVQIKALRSALVLSTADDNKISLLEFFEKYPIPYLYIDLRSLLTFVGDVRQFANRIEPAIAVVQDLLQSVICNCDSGQSTTGPGQSDSSGN
jgi:hypothetical protein